MSRVIEINQIEQLAGYRLAWKALLGQTRMANFFQSLDWLETYWQHCHADQRLRVLVVESCGKPIGIVPLVVRTQQSPLGTARYLNYPLDDWGSLYGPIGPHPTATLLAAMGHIARTPHDWDYIDLRWINRTGTDRGRTHRALEAVGLSPVRQPGAETALVDLTTSWDAYWADRSPRLRSNYRHDERALAARGQVEFLRHRPLGASRGDDDPRWDLYDACIELSARSWQASTTGTTLAHRGVSEFLRAMHHRATHAGTLDMSLLLVDRRPVAFAYGYHLTGYVTGLRMGFDADVPGAGKVLFGRLLRDSFDRGDQVFDLGSGSLQWKRHWSTTTVASEQLSCFPLSDWRAQMVRLGRSAQRLLGGRHTAADRGARAKSASMSKSGSKTSASSNEKSRTKPSAA